MARAPLTPIQKQYRRRSRIVSLIAAAIFVGGVFATKPLWDRPDRADDFFAMIAGFLMLQTTVIMIVSYVMPPKDPEAGGQQRLTYVLTALSAAASLLLPIAGEGLIDPRLNFAIILVLLVASVWFLWRVWRGGDELRRAIITESYAANYLVLAYALSVYAVGERLGLFSGVTAWGALAFATFATFPVSIWLTIRRGTDQPPDEE